MDTTFEQDLAHHCRVFKNNHPMDKDFDSLEFFEKVAERELIEFFKRMYRLV